MPSNTFFCIDAHTCGNPVRVVAGGSPILNGNNMAEKRLDFLKNHDWIRKGLMFEPRGHDVMSGSMLYEPTEPENDIGILFIETSGCLPMCGHGTIGTVTVMIEKGLVHPKVPGKLKIEVPAGLIEVEYKMQYNKVQSVKLVNIPSYLHYENIRIDVTDLGELTLDIAYGGNFYAIIDPQLNYPGLEMFSVKDILRYSPIIRKILNKKGIYVHPDDSRINGLSHIMWTGKPLNPSSTARNAVFYGDKAIDRSPCGTGTSARMAQWAAKGMLKAGENFIHESIIGSTFIGKIEAFTKVGDKEAIVPSIEGWAKITGFNTISIDPEDDPYAYGFIVE